MLPIESFVSEKALGKRLIPWCKFRASSPVNFHLGGRPEVFSPDVFFLPGYA
jgi:hypothetical protein